MQQWNGDGQTAWWNSGTVMVEQCGGTLEQCGGRVWWNSGTVLCNSVVEQWNSDGGTVKQ